MILNRTSLGTDINSGLSEYLLSLLPTAELYQVFSPAIPGSHFPLSDETWLRLALSPHAAILPEDHLVNSLRLLPSSVRFALLVYWQQCLLMLPMLNITRYCVFSRPCTARRLGPDTDLPYEWTSGS